MKFLTNQILMYIKPIILPGNLFLCPRFPRNISFIVKSCLKNLTCRKVTTSFVFLFFCSPVVKYFHICPVLETSIVSDFGRLKRQVYVLCYTPYQDEKQLRLFEKRLIKYLDFYLVRHPRPCNYELEYTPVAFHSLSTKFLFQLENVSELNNQNRGHHNGC